MGEKLGYITFCDGTREKEATGADAAYSVAEEVDAKYDDEVAGAAKVSRSTSEYNGGGASSGIERVGGGAIARELELIGEDDDRA